MIIGESPFLLRIEQEQTERTEKNRRKKSLLSLFPPVKFRAMHPLYQRAAGLTETIIGAAIEVHRDKGPGLIESIYEWCMLKELGLRGLACPRPRLDRTRVETKQD